MSLDGSPAQAGHEEDRWLDALLRADADDGEVPDGGFSAGVMAGLPRRRRSYGWLVVLFGALGAGLTSWLLSPTLPARFLEALAEGHWPSSEGWLFLLPVAVLSYAALWFFVSDFD
jgi:hypothetical protein